MTRIKVYKKSPFFIVFFLSFGIIFTILGVVQLVLALHQGFNTSFPSGDWSSVIYTIQGVLFIIMGLAYIRGGKYFIEWDDKQLRYCVPLSGGIVVIPYQDIIRVKIRLFAIHFVLSDRTRVMKLEHLQFEDIRKVKEKFKMMAEPDSTVDKHEDA